MISPLGHNGAWQSLSGVRLDGTALTRFVYLDESGTSRNEPVLVVAGVVVHADTQLVLVEDAIRELIDRYIPEPKRDGYVFHAANLFSGKGVLPEIEDEQVRFAILEQLLGIPVNLNLPLCFGYIKKAKFETFNALKQANGHRMRVAMHAAAIAECTCAVEDWMRARAKSEVAVLFAENNDEVKAAARETQILMRSKTGSQRLRTVKRNHLLPLVKIKDGINFVTKPESLALQLADSCAWAFRKRITVGSKADRFYKLIYPAIANYTMTSMDAAARDASWVGEILCRMRMPTN